MLQQMLFHFNTFNLFPSHQSGFRKGHSTEAALLKLTSDIARGSGYGRCTVLVSLDLSKAYDCVPHSNLVSKFSTSFSFSSFSTQMISNYLRDRSQMVVSKHGTQSDVLRIFRGMPQGGNLCCLLFSAYLDLPAPATVLLQTMSKFMCQDSRRISQNWWIPSTTISKESLIGANQMV